MKKIVKLTESDLTRLVNKIVKEQMEMEDPSEDYFKIIDMVGNHGMQESDDFDEVERCIKEIYKIMLEVEFDENLSDEQAADIMDYAQEVAEELESLLEEL